MRRTRADGERSYQLIVDTAARLATLEGLEGLSIGRLADEIGMSKSGLYAHFASKEDLQLAAIDAAEAVYAREVVEPAMGASEGRANALSCCASGPCPTSSAACSPAAASSPPPPPNGTAAAARSGSACARCSTDGLSCSKPTCAKPSGTASWEGDADLQQISLRDQRPAARGERPLPALRRPRRARASPQSDPPPARRAAPVALQMTLSKTDARPP